MKFCLGFPAQNEAFMLQLTLPVVRPHFDGAICAYQESGDDTLKILNEFNVKSLLYRDLTDFSDARNTIIKSAEHDGYDYMVMIDADEAMLPDDIEKFKLAAVALPESAWVFPRHEFVDDFQHYVPDFWPDYQARAFPLGNGFHYCGELHEQLCARGMENPVSQTPLCHAADQPLFHYGKSKPTRDVALKYLNYERFKHKQSKLKELPADYVIPESWSLGANKIEFTGPRPI